VICSPSPFSSRQPIAVVTAMADRSILPTGFHVQDGDSTMSSRSAKTAGECVKPRVLCALAVSTAIAFISIGIYAAAGAGPVCPMATEGGNGGRQIPQAEPAVSIKLGNFWPETMQADCWKASAWTADVKVAYEYHEAKAGDEKIVKGLIKKEFKDSPELKFMNQEYLDLKFLKDKYTDYSVFEHDFGEARGYIAHLSRKVGVAFQFEFTIKDVSGFTTKDVSGHEKPWMTTVVQNPVQKPGEVCEVPLVIYKVDIEWSTEMPVDVIQLRGFDPDHLRADSWSRAWTAVVKVDKHVPEAAHEENSQFIKANKDNQAVMDMNQEYLDLKFLQKDYTNFEKFVDEFNLARGYILSTHSGGVGFQFQFISRQDTENPKIITVVQRTKPNEVREAPWVNYKVEIVWSPGTD